MSVRLVFGICVLAACSQGGDGSSGDGGSADARLIDAPIDAIPAETDLVPAVGGASTLELMTWNIRMFPSTEQTPEILADLIASMDVDIVVFQEVDDARAFQRTDARLYGWATALPSVPGGRTGSVGVAYREGLVTLGEPELLFLADGDFPRPPVVLPITVGGETFSLIVVHLKAGFDASDQAARVGASATLEAEVRARVDGAGEDAIAVIGDWNTALSDSRADEVFAPWRDARYNFVTEDLAEGGGVTFLPSDVELDHIVTTTAFDAIRGSAQPQIIPLDAQFGEYRTIISDHVPLVVKMPMP